ncbi:hypothetical protein [Pseudomonas putida]
MQLRDNLTTGPLAAALLLACVSLNAQAGYLSTAQSVVSDRADMNFKDQAVYFKAPGSGQSATQFSDSLNACVQFNVDDSKKQGQGSQVMQSMGYTEADIINEGSRLCMESKGWALYSVQKGQLQHVNSHLQTYASMDDMQLKIAKNLIANQREWFLEYAPAVLAVGDLK